MKWPGSAPVSRPSRSWGESCPTFTGEIGYRGSSSRGALVEPRCSRPHGVLYRRGERDGRGSAGRRRLGETEAGSARRTRPGKTEAARRDGRSTSDRGGCRGTEVVSVSARNRDNLRLSTSRVGQRCTSPHTRPLPARARRGLVNRREGQAFSASDSSVDSSATASAASSPTGSSPTTFSSVGAS